jgi:signal transduction histidine kinase
VEDDDDLVDLPATLPLEEHPFMRRAMATGRVATGRFTDTGPRVAAAAAALRLVSGAWAPIWTGTTLFGVLAASTRDEAPFQPEELRLLEGIAHLAGLAIGNAQSLRLERERAHIAREHAERMAAVEQVKSEFLRLASHELRGPLAVLGGYLSMLDEGSIDGDQLQRVLPVLTGKVAEMNRLVDQMLETARLEEGKLRLETAPADLVALVEEAVHAVLPLGAPRHRVRVDAAEAAVPVNVDASRIVTVVANLVSNAVKYSPGGGEVHCSVAVDHDRAVVRVTDHGIGIAAADLPRLFTRFGRVVTPENSHIAGTGLGLYLARELARMHGGDISVASEQGEGSTFTMWLPLSGAPQELAGTPVQLEPEPSSDAHHVRPALQQ